MGLFHFLPSAEWETVKSGQRYEPASLAIEGFIHFSYDRQLLSTAQRYFAGRRDMIVLSVRRDVLRAELRDELVNGETFPHLYGPLNLDAVVDAWELPLGADGTFDLPEALRPWRPYFQAPRST